uniref:HlyD family secretion protein n=1 Tax=Candidatus Kentrum sp. TUN TaxID=2126343 RepID=A0A450ZPS3_9GAMM|nr:MAG: HlyD family secretion protein [Candidatus Kentron sp. TUN]VFK53149.1 MAG: HlyD family secretion protein [Candidatus Kentron sp. TUN]VFK55711.1 MAG: HlyD family secretion protein [Candidatus Kentron sp. TUN]
MAKTATSAELLAVSALLQLQERIWAAGTTEELAFIAVNETHMMVPYRQAILWIQDKGVVAVSGVAMPGKDAPFIQWIRRLLTGLAIDDPPHLIRPHDLEQKDAEEWRSWLPDHGFVLPLTGMDNKRFGLLLLVRDENWSTIDAQLIKHLVATYSYAWVSLTRSGKQTLARPTLKKWLLGILALTFISCLFIPVPLTVLAPAEIVPVNPTVVRSPLDGVVDRIWVRPNQKVLENEPLFDLDKTTLNSRIEVAEKNLYTVEAEYRQTVQQAMVERNSKAKLAILKGKADEQQSEINHLRSLIARSRITASQEGIIILDDPTEWIGRPVMVGERVMMIADEFNTEVEAWVSIGDAIALAPGTMVKVFLNADPLHSVEARLRTFSYEAIPRPDGNLAYRVRAMLHDTESRRRIRIGLRGTARIAGQRVILAYWMFRRPLAVIRQALGL